MNALEESLQVVLREVEPEARLDAVEALSQQFEHGDWDSAQAEPVVQTLVRLTVLETHAHNGEALLEAFLFAIHQACIRHRLAGVDLEPLADLVDALSPSLVDYCVSILGTSVDERYRPILERCLVYPDEDVRQTASDALDDLNVARHG